MSHGAQTIPDYLQTWMNSIDDMDDRQLQQWAKLLEQRTGMCIRNSRKSFLMTGIRLRMRELGFTDYQRYYDYLHSGRQGAIEWATLVDRLTIHETRFFRHGNVDELLLDDFLPDYLAADRPAQNIQGWSVGCATGEEAYSLAILLEEYKLKHFANFYYGITGSDISLPAVATARKGIYDSRKLKNVSPTQLQQYFTTRDAQQFQVNPALRRRVCFNQLNILQPANDAIGMMDIILCQNVLIYFDMALRRQILDSLANHLNPGGILIIGVGEAMDWKHPMMKRVPRSDSLAYRKQPTMEECGDVHP